MRQQLIDWLTEDIAPEIKKSNDPEGSILKFARENNLCPAQVEAIGQIYNTAKTLKFLQKAANRGGSFPLLDVDAMTAKFLEVHEKKSSTVHVEFIDEEDVSLSSLFEEALYEPVRTKVASAEAPAYQMVDPNRDSFVQKEARRVRLDMAQQAAFDFKEDIAKELEKVAYAFRTQPHLDFAAIEADALALNPDLKPVLEKVAGYLIQRNRLPVTRAKQASTTSLVDDRHGLFPVFDAIHDLSFSIQAAEDIIKEATLTEDEKEAPPKDQGRNPHKNVTPEKAPAEPSKDLGAPVGSNFKPGRPTESKPRGEGSRPSSPEREGGFFDPISGAMDSVAKAVGGKVGPMAEKALLGQNNSGQRSLDRDMQDTKHTAMLQALLATDEVLSEADPDRVVEIYNTVRETAPSLAGDINAMRVFLRSAVQHDGISPFDLKGLLDTELAKQKVDLNTRHLDAHLYRGKELPGVKP